MRLDGLFENLDDQDQFAEYCPICHLHETMTDIDAFHTAHEESAAQASSAATDPPAMTKAWWNRFSIEMGKRGYVREKGSWVNVGAIREALDDKDVFTKDCDICERNENATGKQNPPDFHIAHYAAEDAINRAIAYMVTWTSGPEVATRIFDAEMGTMRKYGYVVKATNSQGYKIWVKPSLKEALDDKDEFVPKGGGCYFCGNDYNLNWIRTEDGGRRHSWFLCQYCREAPELQPYVVKEDLDDKDEFSHGGNVHHRQAWDSNENLQHWLITIWDMNPARRIYASDNIRIEGEYYVRGGKAGGMSVTTNTSNVDENTAERMLQAASSIGIGSYDVDWDQAVADAQGTGY